MRHSYTRTGEELLPLLAVGVYTPNGYYRDSMLLDSGTQNTLMRLSLLEEFGVELEDRVELAGVGGTPFGGRRATVEFAVDGYRFAASVIAVEDKHLPIALLGHRGFFEHFRVTFDTSQSRFQLQPVR